MKRTPAFTLLALLAAPVAAGPPGAAAAEITLESRSYLPMSEDGAGGKHATAYEYLDLGLEDLGPAGLYLRAGGWGRADLADDTFDRTTNGELQYGYLGYRAGSSNAELRLGRVSVTAGAARNEVLDGIEAATDLAGGFEALLFGGVPLETDEGGRSGDTVWGGRLAQGLPGVYELGLSYLTEEDDSDPVREEAAVDLWLRPGIPVALSGSSLYNVDTEEFARHDWRLVTEPLLGGLRAGLRYSRTSYGDFFTGPGVSAFLAPAVEPDEKLQSYGADLSLPVAGGFEVAADYTAYRYDIAPDADRYGGRLSWQGGALAAGLGYHRSDGGEGIRSYHEYAADVTTHVGPTHLALGVQELRYDEKINGTRDSLTVFGAADHGISPALSLGADVEYQSSPTYDSRVRGMLKLIWRYAHDTRAGQGGAGR